MNVSNLYFLRPASALLLVVSLAACSNPERDFESAQAANTEAAYREFIATHPDNELADQAWDAIEQFAFDAAANQATIEAYEAFLAEFPSRNHSEAARNALAGIEFSQAIERSTIADWENYLARYPNSPRSEEATEALTALRYDSAIETNSIATYETFLQQHPDSQQSPDVHQRLNTLLEERDWQRANSADTAEAYVTFSETHPDSSRIRVLRGTLNASMGYAMTGLGLGGAGGSPVFMLEFEGDDSFFQTITSQEAVAFGVASYEPINDEVGTVGMKRPMQDSTVVLKQFVNDKGATAYDVVAVIAGPEIPSDND